MRAEDYHDLHTYSVQDYAFWLDLWEFLGITSSVPPSTAHIIGPGRAPHLPIWFPGARLNHAENLLGRSTLTAGDDGIALSVASEGECITSKVRHVSWRELRKMVEEAGKALKEADVQVGDRVARESLRQLLERLHARAFDSLSSVILTNSPTAIALGLGVAAVGGILSPTAPDMGAPGVLDRYRQIRPRMLIVERSYRYGGKRIDLMERWKRVVDELRKFGLEQVVVVPGVGDKDADEGELPLRYVQYMPSKYSSSITEVGPTVYRTRHSLPVVRSNLVRSRLSSSPSTIRYTFSIRLARAGLRNA